MMNNKWKDKYYDHNNVAILDSNARFISPLGSSNGTGTKPNPYQVKRAPSPTSNIPIINIYAGGFIDDDIKFNQRAQSHLYGQGKGLTKANIYNSGNTQPDNMIIKDLTILSVGGNWAPRYATLAIYDCIVEASVSVAISSMRSLFVNNPLNTISGAQNGFLDSVINPLFTFSSNLSIYSGCSIPLTAANINSYKNNYLGFDNCKFKIGNEADYTALAGSTQAQKRQSFVSRCTAQGVTDAQLTVSGETDKVGRWVFSEGATTAGQVITGSEIDNWQRSKFVYLGISQNPIDKITITDKPNVPRSFSSAFPHTQAAIISENSISISDSVDITNDAYSFYVETSPFWLGGRYQLNNLNILDNLPAQYGVLIGSTGVIDTIPVTEIVKDQYYIVRSTNKQAASITYNGVAYSTSLNTRNNIFVGVAGVTSFVDNSGNARLYKLSDLAVQQKVQIRVVNDLPPENITTGNLQHTYWYFVEPNNQNDTSGTVTYKGVVYPAYSSFRADDSSLTFTINGTCHLRRCWRELQYPDTDLDFWENRQKPLWCNIVPNDMRCFMSQNNQASGEMMKDSAGLTYLTSGHSGFYDMVSGEAGYIPPVYPITGVYIQIRISFSTLNPM